MDGYVEGWVDAHVRKIYTTQIYPNLTADQKVMLVPGSFGSNVNHYPNGTFICDNSCYDKMCAVSVVPLSTCLPIWSWNHRLCCTVLRCVRSISGGRRGLLRLGEIRSKGGSDCPVELGRLPHLQRQQVHCASHMLHG
jgi:hypothetical protein